MKGIKILTFIGIALLLNSCVSSSALFIKGDGPAEPYETQVPFTRSLNLIVLEVEIEGETFRFLFDTGAPMLISTELAEKFKFKKLTSKNVTDSQNKRSKLDYVLLPDIAIATNHFTDLTAIVADLQLSPVIACLEIDGIIGANLMRHAVWKIDYQNNVMHFTNKENPYPKLSNSISLPFTTKSTFTPVVELRVDSTIVKNVTFDTGSGSGLSLGRSRLPNFKSNDSSVYSSYGYHTSGIFGSVPDTTYYTQKVVNVGGEIVSGFNLNISNRNGKALLGTQFFEDYDVIIDWNKNEAILNPHQPEMTLTSYGFAAVIEKDKLFVGTIVQGSAVDKAGVSFKDQILSINGIDCSTVTNADYCRIRSIISDKEGDIVLEILDKGSFTVSPKQLL